MGFARKLLLYGMAIATATGVVTAAVHGLEQANARAQPGARITNITAAPYLISPLDVITIGVTVANNAAGADRLSVIMVVRDEMGTPVLQEKQTGIAISENSKQSLSWVWRIPGHLADGTYTVEMTSLNDQGKVLANDSRADAFQVTGSSPSNTG